MLVQTSFPATYVHSLLRLMYGKPSSILCLWEREERGLEVIGFPLLPPPKSFHSSQHDPTERKKPVTVLHFGIKKLYLFTQTKSTSRVRTLDNWAYTVPFLLFS